MISVIITAFQEEKSIGHAINSVLGQNIKDIEIIVVAPDDPTLNAAKKFKNVKIIRDDRKGKPAALNLAFKKISRKSRILVLTDGDVYMDKSAIKNLLRHFDNEKVGAVSGHPVSLSSRGTLLGYASHNFTDWWDWMRRKWQRSRQLLICSGYLFAMRNGIISSIPEDALSDDAMMSYGIFNKNWRIEYEPDAKVYVKYPTTLKDWLKQKRRSSGGYLQTKKYFKHLPETRSFLREAFLATLWVLKYPKSVREYFYTLLLFAYRLWLWTLIYSDRLRKKTLKQVWQPVESTK